MKMVGHGKIPLTPYHINGEHPIILDVDIYITEDNEIKLYYNKSPQSANYVIIPNDKRGL